jgi:hypothetical protein
MTERPRTAERGRLEFFAITGAATLLLLGIALGAWRRGTNFHPVTEFGRLAVFLGLAYLAYGGARWARQLLALWIAFLSLAGVIGAINAGLGSGPGVVLGFGFSAVAIVAAYVFLTSKSIDGFLAGRKGKALGAPPAA